MKFIPFLISIALVTTTAPAFSKNLNGSKSNYSTEAKNTNSKSVLDYEHFKLDNGLEVYLSKNSESPRFRAEIAVRAGSKMDPADATGIAHYLEHMLFKGTEKFGTVDYKKEKVLMDKIIATYDKRFKEKDEAKREELNKEINKLTVEASKYAVPNELDYLYSKMGGSGINAYTSDEETVYIVDLPKNKIEQWAMVESERFAKPVFRLFQSELETVYEEKNRALDNKERLIYEAVDSLMYKVHPYGTQTTLGTVEHLKNPSLTKMYEFYKKYYVPNNMAILLSGDIDIKKTKEVIKKYFSGWKKKDVPAFNPPKEAPLKGIQRKTVNYKGEEKVMLAFRTDNFKSKDKAALTLIDMLLDNGEAGLINLDLTDPQKVRAASSFTSFNDDYGAHYLSAIPKEGQSLEQAEKLLLDELEKIKKGNFDESVISGILISFEKGKKGGLESNSGRIDVMKEAFLRKSSVEEVMNFTEELKKITKKDIVRVANKYFTKSNYVSVYRVDKDYSFPKIEKPNLEKVALNTSQKSAFAKAVDALKSSPVSPKWVDYNKDFKVSSYAPGTLLYYTKNPLNDLFNLSISYDYGRKHNKNLCYVMNELNYAGVDKLSPEAVRKQLYKLGVDLNYSCGDYGFSMNLSGVDSQLEKGLEMGEKILWNAKLEEKHLKDLIQNNLKTREDKKKDVNTVRSALTQYIARDKESVYLDRHTKEELQKISVKEYAGMKKELLKQNFEVDYIGQLPMEKVESLVKKYHFPKTINVPLLNPRPFPPYKIVERHNKPVKIYFLDFKGAQAHINLLIPEGDVEPKKGLIASFFNEYFDGGMGAILFQEVREARALAYSTSAGYYSGGRLGDQDRFAGYIGTQADKTIEALKLFIDLIRNTPDSKKHFDTAKESLDNSYRTGYVNFRGIVGTVKYWGDLGYDQDPRKTDFNTLHKITPDNLKTFIKDKIAPKNLTFSIVGDKTKIDMNELAKIGEVEEITIDKLFTD
jgi:predicted Zn-dependent peptidase